MVGIFSSLVSLVLLAWDSYNRYRPGDASQVATQMQDLNISVKNLQSAIVQLKARLGACLKGDLLKVWENPCLVNPSFFDHFRRRSGYF